MKHSVYVIEFSDDRIKIGITKDARERVRYYEQEATRNYVQYFTWWACKPFKCKSLALYVEREICRQLSGFSIPRHREWFRSVQGDFEAIVNAVDMSRMNLGDEIGADHEDIPFLGRHGSFNYGK
ncbi:MAG: GIY-YIG nuclease family protein [Mariprofundaceae bacterium]|jgi:predicted GIY-YIG superfamily endonuclease|nr:GIY-YIG nuclease family protein [Mariprofundaceae bacterium]